MSNVEQNLLTNSQLTREQLSQTLEYIHQHKVNYADLYFQSSYHETWVLEDGIVKDGSYNIERGVGVRAVSGEKTGFSYSDAINIEALTKAAEAARSIAQAGESSKVQVFSDVKAPIQFQPAQPITSMSDADKVALLREIEQCIRDLAPEAQQVVSSLSAVYEEVLIAASDGTFATDIRPLIRLNCSVLLEKNGRRERGSAGGGARLDYGYFKELVDGAPRWMQFAKEAVRQARVNLEAIDAPAGAMPVVLGSGWPGVLLHEAVGHGLEGDFNRKGASAFSGKIGEQVASSLCTVVDDGTIADRRGSLNVDDEGTPAAYNVLIENGILKGYMQDKQNASLMGVAPTGNARRESYAHLPMPRMTNTYMLAGEHSQEEIIRSVDKGIFASNFGGGQVDITSGKFVFSASEAYLIENGKITQPIKGATLIGNGPEVMKKVSMVGNDLALDKGVGVCGKDGQSVPVGVGQPSLKIDEITVGGTA
ncbi:MULTISPECIES: metalloprotease TldD [Pseudoalteromonas]|uniref:metalloprotease TldD n=1 Tax=Pseudoalteromonas TaxID=53246 RepID=UPI00057C43D9|nr:MULTISPECIES: metalloprotease TldD [Pseudoalteromonas]KID37710.1 protease TldD [Pseudoalteromonas flavipulchra NCIMB 2033 = ATCC BAA-314]KJY91947.1 protease TldD [Pseudoalteromonas piscicida]MBD0783908.1 metalloprotease TldD [Pseudoalteromonas flavipulchra]MBE0374489.1 TldD protein [Pseudoalteromonas flavipulchra NCIMB 2033 = ATCC BAA-314]MCG7541668.1 metalloprotease TldD [Pseudoalteromonas sp. OF7H-1]